MVAQQMNVHEKVKIICPAETAYGEKTVGNVPPNSDLVCILEREA